MPQRGTYLNRRCRAERELKSETIHVNLAPREIHQNISLTESVILAPIVRAENNCTKGKKCLLI